jgi:hypothetical protein
MRWYRGCEWFLNCCVKIILENKEVKMPKKGERDILGTADTD